jgi:hypothetical protein
MDVRKRSDEGDEGDEGDEVMKGKIPASGTVSACHPSPLSLSSPSSLHT